MKVVATTHRGIAFACVVALGMSLVLSAPSPKPAPTKPGGQPAAAPPGGNLTIGGGNAAPNPDDAKARVESTENDVVSGTDLAPHSGATTQSTTNPTTGPATSPSSTQPSSRPTTGPASLYPDVSFDRHVSTRPLPQPRPIPTGIVSDAEIEQSIRLAIDLMADQFDPRTGQLRGRRYSPNYEATECGLNALCVYALIQAGQAVSDPRLNDKSPAMKSLLEGVKRLRADRGTHQTYARALRAATLAVYNRDADRAQLEEDVACLAAGQVDGAYGYLSAVPQGSSPRFNGTAPAGFPSWWADHSNSQYGLLGVWSGAEVGINVPERYWRTALDYWVKAQAVTGQWAYGSSTFWPPGQSPQANPGLCTLSMTAAGTASLFVAGEYAERVQGGFKVGREPFPDPLKKALDWWEQGDHAINMKSAMRHWGYTLYGVERVGLASGFKFFGEHDWYRMLARQVIDKQRPNGSWGNLVETAYALLFLSRGRHPILMNKLRFDGRDAIESDYWANRPNDISYLTRFASKQLERPLNWQIVPLKKDPVDWLDAPILYIASHKRPSSFRPEQIEKLRRYVELGGMIFTNADADEDDPNAGPLVRMARGGAQDSEFNRYVPELAKKLFPDYKLADLPPDHPLYTCLFRLADKPKLKAVSNGSRLLLVHSPQDMAIAWQKRDEAKGRAAFEFGVNLFVYAAGKRDLRNRVDSAYVPPVTSVPPVPPPAERPGKLTSPATHVPPARPPARPATRPAVGPASRAGLPAPVAPGATLPDPRHRNDELRPTTAPAAMGRITVARLSYAGQWSPEPRAWERFANLFEWKTGAGLDVKTMAWKDLKEAAAPIGHVTGVAAYLPNPAERAATKAFVEAGGVLLVDDCGGSGAFTRPLEAVLSATLPNATKTDVKPDHPLLTGGEPGMSDNLKLRLRPWSIEHMGTGNPPAIRVWKFGKGAVVFCPVDLTSGLLGLNTWAINGYEPAVAEGFVRNVILWALDKRI